MIINDIFTNMQNTTIDYIFFTTYFISHGFRMIFLSSVTFDARRRLRCATKRLAHY